MEDEPAPESEPRSPDISSELSTAASESIEKQDAPEPGQGKY